MIVAGYPILRRLDTNTGLQISLPVAAALLNAKRVVQFAGITFIKGFSAMLAATKIIGDTVFWHLIYDPEGSYLSFEDPRAPRGDANTDMPSLDILSQKHHVVGWCENVLNYAGV